MPSHNAGEPLPALRRRVAAIEAPGAAQGAGRGAAKALSGEVETGSLQKMRPLKDNESEFRFHWNEIRSKSAVAHPKIAVAGGHPAEAQARNKRVRPEPISTT